MSYSKAYERIHWENYPSTITPLNEANLNKIDSALDIVDDRVIELETNTVDVAKEAKSYAVGTGGEYREGDDSDNAGYYYRLSKQLSENFSSELQLMGTITFSEIPAEPTAGWVYNISDEFVTDTRFEIGENYSIAAGTLIYYGVDSLWHIPSGTIFGKLPVNPTTTTNLNMWIVTS